MTSEELRQSAKVASKFIETLSESWFSLTREYGKNLIELMQSRAHEMEKEAVQKLSSLAGPGDPGNVRAKTKGHS